MLLSLRLDGTVTGGHHLRVSQSKSAIHSNGLKKRVRVPWGAGGVGGEGRVTFTGLHLAALRARWGAMARLLGAGAGAAKAPARRHMALCWVWSVPNACLLPRLHTLCTARRVTTAAA
jgi:hypothetical protein